MPLSGKAVALVKTIEELKTVISPLSVVEACSKYVALVKGIEVAESEIPEAKVVAE